MEFAKLGFDMIGDGIKVAGITAVIAYEYDKAVKKKNTEEKNKQEEERTSNLEILGNVVLKNIL